MEFSLRDLSVLAYANGFTLWHYKTPRPVRDMLTQPGYFDAASDMLATGDMVMVSAADGGRMVCVSVGQGSVALAPLA